MPNVWIPLPPLLYMSKFPLKYLLPSLFYSLGSRPFPLYCGEIVKGRRFSAISLGNVATFNDQRLIIHWVYNLVDTSGPIVDL